MWRNLDSLSPAAFVLVWLLIVITTIYGIKGVIWIVGRLLAWMGRGIDRRWRDGYSDPARPRLVDRSSFVRAVGKHPQPDRGAEVSDYAARQAIQSTPDVGTKYVHLHQSAEGQLGDDAA